MVNIQGAWRGPPALCSLGGKEEDAPPPNSPPSKSHDLALSTCSERAAILAPENSSWEKDCHSMMATSPLSKTALL